jgi:hypothetical protein
MKADRLIFLALCLCFAGCIPMPPPYLNPGMILRNAEGEFGSWYLLVRVDLDRPDHQDNKPPDGLAVQVPTVGSIFLWQGKYRFVPPFTNEPDRIMDSRSVPADFRDVIYAPPIDMGKNARGRVYFDDTRHEEVTFLGPFINIDKLFLDNPWCKFIIVDDTSDGLLFRRDGGKCRWLSYSELYPFAGCRIVHRSRDYSSLMKLSALGNGGADP